MARIRIPTLPLTLTLLLLLNHALYARAGVLVTGGTGRLGRRICASLRAQNVPTTVLVRDLRAATALPELQGCSLVLGNVADIESIRQACRQASDVQSIICVHGVRPPRLSKLSDLLAAGRPRDSDAASLDPNHPATVNLQGTKNVLMVMQETGIPKLVRVTGALVGKPNTFFSALFNLLLSFSNMYHELSEVAIRASGLDYTILRPTGIRDEPSCAEHNAEQADLQEESLKNFAALTETTVETARDWLQFWARRGRKRVSIEAPMAGMRQPGGILKEIDDRGVKIEASFTNNRRNLLVAPGDGPGGVPIPGTISIPDLAELCVLAAGCGVPAGEAGGAASVGVASASMPSLSRATLVVSSTKETTAPFVGAKGPEIWAQALITYLPPARGSWGDWRVLVPGAHRRNVALLLAAMAAVAVGSAWGLVRLAAWWGWWAWPRLVQRVKAAYSGGKGVSIL